MNYDLEKILANLESEMPPSSLGVIEPIVLVDWNKIESEQLELCVNIILRISADLIIHRFGGTGDQLIAYEDIFEKIKTQIESSQICELNEDFSRYFDKYCEYFGKKMSI